MAKILQWTDAVGNEYPESCWIPVFQSVDYPNAARFVFHGFKDKFAAASYLATGTPSAIPGAVKEYVVPADKVREVCGPLLAQVTELIYNYAATVADTLADPDAPESVDNPKVPFFHEAPEAELPAPPVVQVSSAGGRRRGRPA